MSRERRGTSLQPSPLTPVYVAGMVVHDISHPLTRSVSDNASLVPRSSHLFAVTIKGSLGSILHFLTQYQHSGCSLSPKQSPGIEPRTSALYSARCPEFNSSLAPRPHPARISLPVYITRGKLKAIRTGVSFGSGTEIPGSCWFFTFLPV